MPFTAPRHSILALASAAVIAGCGRPVAPYMPGGEPPDAGTVDSLPAGCLKLNAPEIDFGSVVVGEHVTRDVTVTNRCRVPIELLIGEVTGTDPLPFTTWPPSGTLFPLNHGETASLVARYGPVASSLRPSEAYFWMTACEGPGCGVLVSLRGTGIASAATVDPSTLDFGFVPPNRQVPKFVTLTNVGTAPVRLIAAPQVLNTDATGGTASAGAFQPGVGFPTKDQAVSPGQSLQFPVVFTPASTNKFLGELDIATDDPGTASLSIPLTGFGGGAVVLCSPQDLDFGLNAVGITSTLAILCTNIGQNVPGHPESNLLIVGYKVVDDDGDGDWDGALTLDPPFPDAGLAAGQSFALYVTYDSSLADTDGDGDGATLFLTFNDPTSPPVGIHVSGIAKALPDCDFQLNPPSGLDFGRVEVGSTASAFFEIANNGSSDCLVNALQISAGSSPAFSLPDYPPGTNSSPMLPAATSLYVEVQFAPTAVQASFAGAVAFTISDKSRQHQSVSLTGTSQ